jgi:two-component system sensor histidine kinase/response regulator
MDPKTNSDNSNQSVDKLVLADLRSLTAVDPSRFHKIVSLFLDGLAVDLPSIRSALAAKDKARLKELVHALKGTSASMGATRLATLCAEMEEACEADQFKSAGEEFTNIEAESSRVTAILAAEIAR